MTNLEANSLGTRRRGSHPDDHRRGPQAIHGVRTATNEFDASGIQIYPLAGLQCCVVSLFSFDHLVGHRSISSRSPLQGQLPLLRNRTTNQRQGVAGLCNDPGRRPESPRRIPRPGVVRCPACRLTLRVRPDAWRVVPLATTYPVNEITVTNEGVPPC
jgi:hypothetical protein